MPCINKQKTVERLLREREGVKQTTAIKFDLAPVTDADKKQGNISGLIDNFSFNQLPNELRLYSTIDVG